MASDETHNLHIPHGVFPESHEIEIAQILSLHFNSRVTFLSPSGAYKVKTPDVDINGVLWEIKSPVGDSRQSTIKRQFKGLKQSRNLVISSARTKLDDDYIRRQIRLEIAARPRKSQILFIGKDRNVIDLP